MKQTSGRDGDGDADSGVHRERAEDAAGGGRGPLREMNSGGGYAAPTPRATGLRPRARAGRPSMALTGPRVLERHRDAEESPREREASSEEGEAKELAVRPRAARRECPERGGASEEQSPATALGGRTRFGHHHDAVEWPRESEPPSRDSGALVVRARGAPRERPEGGWTSDTGADLGRHHGGLVRPRKTEPKRGFDANGEVRDDEVSQHHRGVRVTEGLREGAREVHGSAAAPYSCAGEAVT